MTKRAREEKRRERRRCSPAVNIRFDERTKHFHITAHPPAHFHTTARAYSATTVYHPYSYYI